MKIGTIGMKWDVAETMQCSSGWLVAMVVAFALIGLPAIHANPEGESVRRGRATFERSGDELIIRQKDDRIVVEWDSFSIDRDERTIFVQPDRNSSALNRVMLGRRSLIAGRLEANGQVILINPAGITVTSTGVVNVNSFIGSTLNLADDDFLAGGELHFSGSSSEELVNLGTIRAVSGDVHLLARRIRNEGTIEAPEGLVGLGAGSEILIQPDADEPLYIRKGAGDERIDQAGAVRAAAAEIKATGNPYAMAINLDGVLEVKGSKSRPTGRATVASTNGGVRVGRTASVKAKAANGGGGQINLRGSDVQMQGGSIDASGTRGGKISARGQATVVVASTMTVGGSAGFGGDIEILATHIHLSPNAYIEASGTHGGGEVLVGGDYQGGRDPGRRYAEGDLPNAASLDVEAGARLRADATGDGSGGTVILWSEETTRSLGSISVRGGAGGGNGGFVEVSGREWLSFGGTVDLAAPRGRPGTLLLDPDRLSIRNEAPGSLDGSLPTIPSSLGTGSASVSVQALEAISSGTILLSATGRNGTGILVEDLDAGGDGEVNLQSGVSLELVSEQGRIRFLNPSNGIVAAGDGSISLRAGTTGRISSIVRLGRIHTDRGAIALLAEDGINIMGSVSSVAGNIVIDSDSDGGNGGKLVLGSDADITAQGGSISINFGREGAALDGPVSAENGSLTLKQSRGNEAPINLNSTIFATNDLSIGLPIIAADGATIVTAERLALANHVAVAADGTLTLRSNALDIESATFINPASSNLRLEPYQRDRTIHLGGPGGTGDGYDVSDGTIARISGFGSVTIGRRDGSGAISTEADVDFNTSVTLLSSGAGGSASISHALSTGAGALTIAVAGDLSISGDGRMTSASAGDAIILAADRFLNSGGSQALSAPVGRWLIYANDPSDDNFGGLASGNTALWNRDFDTSGPSTIGQPGNRYLFSPQPNLTFSTGNLQKTYGDDISGRLPYMLSGGLVTETFGGAILPDSPANAFAGAPLVSSDGASASADVGNYAILLSRGTLTSAAGYGFRFDNGILNVDPKGVVVAPRGGISTYGDSPANPGLSVTGLVNGQSADVLTGLMSNFDINRFTAAGTHLLEVVGTLTNANYFVERSYDAQWNVLARGVSVSANSGGSTYGDAPANPGLSATGLVNGETVAVLTGLANSFGVGSLTPAGRTVLGVAGVLTNPNYRVTARLDGEWIVDPKDISVDAIGGRSTYGDEPSNPGFTATGLVNGETLSVLTGLFNDLSVTRLSDAERYDVRVAGVLTNTNYRVTSRGGALWTVDPREITVEAIGGESTYGDQPANPGIRAIGLVNGQSESVLVGLFNDLSVTALSDAGSYVAQVAGSSANLNYRIVRRDSADWTVQPKGVVVTALDGSSIYGDNPVSPGFTASGLVNGQGDEILTGLFSSVAANGRSNVGAYAVTVTGTSTNPNYRVEARVDGLWTVSPREISVSAIGGRSIYGDRPRDPGLQAVGLVNGDGINSLVGLASSFDITHRTNAGTYDLRVQGELANANYVIADRQAASWSVDPRPIDVTALGGESAFGAAATNPGISVSGLVNGDTVDDLSGLFNSFGISSESQPGTYELTVDGRLTNDNYTIEDRVPGFWTVLADALAEPDPEPQPVEQPIVTDSESPLVEVNVSSEEAAVSSIADSVSAPVAVTEPAPSTVLSSPASASAAIAGAANLRQTRNVRSQQTSDSSRSSSSNGNRSSSSTRTSSSTQASTASSPASNTAVIDSAAAAASSTAASDQQAASNEAATDAAGTDAAPQNAAAGPPGTNNPTSHGPSSSGRSTLPRETYGMIVGKTIGARDEPPPVRRALAKVEESPEVQAMAPLNEFTAVFVIMLGVAIAQLTMSSATPTTTPRNQIPPTG